MDPIKIWNFIGTFTSKGLYDFYGEEYVLITPFLNQNNLVYFFNS